MNHLFLNNLRSRFFRTRMAMVRVLGDISAFGKTFFIYAGVLTLLEGITSPLLTLVLRELMNELQLHTRWKSILIILFAYVMIGLLASLIITCMEYMIYKYSLKFNTTFQERMLTKMSHLHLSDYEDSEVYDKINRAEYEGEDKLLLYTNNALSIISGLVSIALYLIIVVKYNLLVTIVIAIVPLVRFIFQNYINQLNFNNVKSRTNDERKCWYIKYLFSYGDGYKELKINDLFKNMINECVHMYTGFNKQDVTVKKKESKGIVLLDVLEAVINFIVIVSIIHSGYVGAILFGDILSFIQSISAVRTQMTNVLKQAASLNKESLFIQQLCEFLDLKEIENDDDKKIRISEINTIEVKELSYRYPSNTYDDLRKITFRINKGESVLLVGPNGSGKSTLIKLLLGFYEDYQGEILINGQEISNLNKKNYYSHVGVLLQDYIQYQTSIRLNIAYGKIDDKSDDEKISKICEDVMLGEVISALEHGIDTQIGNWFDNGIQLSSGQWQKIAIGRSLIKNADLYFLDEPNSSLDPISSDTIFRLFNSLLEDKTRVYVLHNFSRYVNDVDKIIVISNGEVIDEGTHAELIERCRLYYDLYTAQNPKI